MAKVKAHLFYHDDKLYAITLDNTLAEQFMEQRSMDCIKYKTKKMEEDDYKYIMANNMEKMLVANPLESKHGVVTVATTYSEDEQLSSYIEYLQKDIDDALLQLKRLPFKDRYKKILLSGFHSINKKLPDGLELNIDTVSLFVDLFQFTFVDNTKGGVEKNF